jgi:hypothetical protein
VITADALFGQRPGITWLAVAPAKWSGLAALGLQPAADAPRYAAQFALWLVLLTLAASAIGHRPSHFIGSFACVYLLSAEYGINYRE